MRETEKSYDIAVVAPGLKKENFKIQVVGDVLTVSFAQDEQTKEQDAEKGWLRREYQARSFSRSFGLSDKLDAANIAASYADGILQLSIAKKEGSALSRTIEIQ